MRPDVPQVKQRLRTMSDDQPTAHDATPLTPPAPGPSTQYLFWWGALLLVVGGLLGAGIMNLIRPTGEPRGLTAGPLQPLPVLGRIPAFELIERDGRTVTSDDLAGRVWAADFFFTSCAGICPMMSSAMARLQERVLDNAEVTLVSISVDPERDQPDRLRRYAEKYGADATRWWFLTGDKQAIYKLARESFRLGVEEVPANQREPDTEEVLHSGKFVLIDRRARIRGYYDGELPETVDLLARDIKRLLKE